MKGSNKLLSVCAAILLRCHLTWNSALFHVGTIDSGISLTPRRLVCVFMSVPWSCFLHMSLLCLLPLFLMFSRLVLSWGNDFCSRILASATLLHVRIQLSNYGSLFVMSSCLAVKLFYCSQALIVLQGYWVQGWSCQIAVSVVYLRIPLCAVTTVSLLIFLVMKAKRDNEGRAWPRFESKHIV